MPRSIIVTGSHVHPKLHHVKQRVIGRIPKGNRRKINGPSNQQLSVTPQHNLRGFRTYPYTDPRIPSHIPLPPEIKSFLFETLNNEKDYPITSLNLPQEKRNENLEIRAEAALVLSLCGYTTNRLIEPIKSLIRQVTRDSDPTQSLTFTFFVGTTPKTTPTRKKRPEAELYLLAALYNIYVNLNDRQSIKNLMAEHNINENILESVLSAFKPTRLEKIALEKH